MARTLCIIQARRQSSRLPNKVLLPLAGKPVLQHVIERCQKIDGVSDVIVASPEGETEVGVAELARQSGAHSRVGSLNDVLARYWHAAQDFEGDYVMRVTADCPLIDPTLCSMLIKKIRTEKADFAGLGGWPHGLDCEIFSRNLLDLTYKSANSFPDREHVTLWMKRQTDIQIVGLVPEMGSFREGNRWVLDYPEDYEFLRELFQHISKYTSILSWREVLDIVDRNPQLRDINKHREEEWEKRNKKILESSQEYGRA